LNNFDPIDLLPRPTRLSRTRQKINRVEVIQTLKDLALKKTLATGVNIGDLLTPAP
jgi:hypothetical protein